MSIFDSMPDADRRACEDAGRVPSDLIGEADLARKAAKENPPDVPADEEVNGCRISGGLTFQVARCLSCHQSHRDKSWTDRSGVRAWAEAHECPEAVA